MFAKRFFRNKLSLFGLAIVIILVLVSFLAGYIQPYDPLKISISNRTQAPSKSHTFGTDHFGRDIFSRLLSGAKISLTVGIVSVVLGAFIGIILGALGGYFGGWIDYAITLIMDAIISFPAILLAIGLMSVMGLGVTNIIIGPGLHRDPPLRADHAGRGSFHPGERVRGGGSGLGVGPSEDHPDPCAAQRHGPADRGDHHRGGQRHSHRGGPELPRALACPCRPLPGGTCWPTGEIS